MGLILERTLGKDWQELFDLQLANCRKPSFFQGREAPFYSVDRSQKDWRGSGCLQLAPGQTYLEGNFGSVESFY